MKNATLLLCLALLATTSCARLTVWQKSGIIIGTAGTAGALMATANQASAASTVASGVGAALLPAGACIATGFAEATKEQSDFAEKAARRYMEALDDAKKKELAKPGSELIAVKTLRAAKTRGEGTVMIYNTKTRKLQNNKTFDIRKLPEPGTRLKLETEIAEYVGEVQPLPKPSTVGKGQQKAASTDKALLPTSL
jgi:hypothetical protein